MKQSTEVRDELSDEGLRNIQPVVFPGSYSKRTVPLIFVVCGDPQRSREVELGQVEWLWIWRVKVCTLT